MNLEKNLMTRLTSSKTKITYYRGKYGASMGAKLGR